MRLRLTLPALLLALLLGACGQAPTPPPTLPVVVHVTPPAATEEVATPTSTPPVHVQVAGKICQDLNDDGVCQAGEPGIPYLPIVTKSGGSEVTEFSDNQGIWTVDFESSGPIVVVFDTTGYTHAPTVITRKAYTQSSISGFDVALRPSTNNGLTWCTQVKVAEFSPDGLISNMSVDKQVCSPNPDDLRASQVCAQEAVSHGHECRATGVYPEGAAQR